MKWRHFLLCLIFPTVLVAQDSAYTRRLLKELCSEKLYGRGYLKGGLKKAEVLLTKELKQAKLQPLFGESYRQDFWQTVNTFPSKMELSINGIKLRAGYDYIPSADNASLKGTCTLTQKDSVTFIGSIDGRSVAVILKNKLTYTVGHKSNSNFIFELDRNQFKALPRELKVNMVSKLLSNFEAANVGGFIKGSSESDSVLVFTAHYDHLGGLGKHCYFPGANDNASGVSMVLNLMKYYSEHPLRYKIVFLFFAGEEAGLVGSNYFVESNALDLKKIKFLINLDLMGTGDDGVMVVNGAIHTKEFERLQTINSTKHLLPEVKKRGKAANSDHYWFTEKGVPCFFLYTMGGIKAYHDVYDIEKTLPLTKYKEVYQLLIEFTSGF